MEWKGVKTLVTGGASFIGSHLVDALMERGAHVRVVDNLSSGEIKNIQGHIDARRIEFKEADLRDPGVTREAVSDMQVAFHLAADHGGRGVVDFIGPCRVADNLVRAGELLATLTPTAGALAALGTSGYVVHTVASAFYCFLKTPDDFEETVISAVMGGHDTDTTGAVAGAIAGAHQGLDGIPARWLTGVEDRDRLERLAREIYTIAISGRR